MGTDRKDSEQRTASLMGPRVTKEHPMVSDLELAYPGVGEESDEESTKMRGIEGSAPIRFMPVGAKATLKVLQGPIKGQVFTLDGPYSTIGRGPDNQVILKDDFASTRHAAIYFAHSMEWRIEDLGSRNGTLLNGSKVKEFAIRSGDKILIGDHLLQFTVDSE
jgi:pSer/pThr/pTyr-binding forkhead associated (FHA) protein